MQTGNTAVSLLLRNARQIATIFGPVSFLDFCFFRELLAKIKEKMKYGTLLNYRNLRLTGSVVLRQPSCLKKNTIIILCKTFLTVS